MIQIEEIYARGGKHFHDKDLSVFVEKTEGALVIVQESDEEIRAPQAILMWLTWTKSRTIVKPQKFL